LISAKVEGSAFNNDKNPFMGGSSALTTEKDQFKKGHFSYEK